MQQLRGKYFGETEQALALALHEAGLSDTDIALQVGTSVNNISWWRRDEGLSEHGGPSAPIVTIVREPVRRIAPAPDPRLVTPAVAQTACVGAVRPSGANALSIGTSLGQDVAVDLEELLTTRLLIQGNSGSGKSHLLRKLLEESAGKVQQIIIDPEGDFATFGEAYGHMVVDAVDYSLTRAKALAARVREHRASVVFNLDGLDLEGQMNAAAAFLSGLFEAPREQWYPAIVAIDEAHLFAPAQDNGEDKDVRKASQQAMADLMCRGRKRGLAGIIATQRLAKLHKNVAAEASNFLMGRTFLDIDIGRAADLLGLPRAQTEQIRDLSRGEFLGLGPAISRRPTKVKIGAVQTAGRSAAPADAGLPPQLSASQLADLMNIPDEEEAPKPALRVVK